VNVLRALRTALDPARSSSGSAAKPGAGGSARERRRRQLGLGYRNLGPSGSSVRCGWTTRRDRQRPGGGRRALPFLETVLRRVAPGVRGKARYYQVLGVDRSARRRDQEVVPQARRELPSGRQRARPEAEEKFKERPSLRGLSDSDRGRPTTASATTACVREASPPARASETCGHLRHPLRRRRIPSVASAVALPRAWTSGGRRDRPGGGPRGSDARGLLRGCQRLRPLPRQRSRKPGTPIETCDRCEGTGQIREVSPEHLRAVVRAMPLRPNCGGDGRIPETRRASVAGGPAVSPRCGPGRWISGRDRERTAVRIEGAGQRRWAGGRQGDLYVEIRVAADERFTRQGTELISSVEVPAPRRSSEVRSSAPTLDGELGVEVPAGTQHGEVASPRRRGLPPLRGGRRGDQHVSSSWSCRPT